MKYILPILLLAIAANSFAKDNFYELEAVKINGDMLKFEELKGKKLMIVNVASKCGYTYQYSELQSLYEEYGGENFEIIGFPANNFSNQEPGTDEDIEEFCTENYGVTFTMMSKISVVGADKHPVYQWLTQKSKNGVADQEVLWNFQKYLIDEWGNLVGIYSTQTSPQHQEIKIWLETPSSVRDNISGLKLYPNPANNVVNIEFENAANGKWFVTDITGKVIMNAEFNSVNGSIDLSGLAPGVYFISNGIIKEIFIKN
jgi:glutathione peroxidase